VSDLFRRQVVESRENRLYGAVLLTPRIPHIVITSFLVVWVGLVLLWLTNSSFARKETVVGWLEPSDGNIRVYAKDQGAIEQVLVKEGQLVTENQVLVVMRSVNLLPSGEALENVLLRQLESQLQLAQAQLSNVNTTYQHRREALDQRRAASSEDLRLLEDQQDLMNQRYEISLSRIGRYRALQDEKHLARQILDEAVADELSQRSGLRALSREKVDLSNAIRQAAIELELDSAREADEESRLLEHISEIEQQIAQLQNQRQYTVNAPRAGVVSNLQAKVGQQIRVGNAAPMLTLNPHGGELTVKMLVPIRSAGFVAPGQSLDIRYDAFPYQRFGLFRGQVLTVSETLLLPSELLNAPVTVQEPAYLIEARLDDQGVTAYGQHFALKAGMTLSADIRLDDRSLMRWLLEPIFSLKGRL
jgi:membrane fusion protein